MAPGNDSDDSDTRRELGVIQLSARDVQVTSRSPGNTLTNSQLVLVDGRSAYLDFFGLVLWDLLPTNFDDVEQIEVVRGPASAVWGANAMTGAVNIITKPPRESVGTTVTLSGGYVDRNDGSGTGRGAGSLFGANATVTRAPNDRVSYRVSAGYFTSAAFARPTGRIPVIDDPRQPGQTVGGAFYPLDSAAAAVGTGFANRGTSQPKFDVRVDQELSHGTLTYAGGVTGTDGLIHSGIGPFDMQSGTYLGYGKLTYTRGGLRVQFFTNVLNGQAPNLLLPDLATGRPLQLDFTTQTYDGEIWTVPGSRWGSRRSHAQWYTDRGVVYHTTLHFCAVVVCIFHPSSSFQNRASGEPGQLAGDTRRSRAKTPRVARDPGGGFLVLSAS